MLTLAFATIHYGNGGVFSDISVQRIPDGPLYISTVFFLNLSGIIVGVSGIPLLKSKSLVAISLVCQAFLFEYEKWISEETMLRQLGFIMTPVAAVGLTVLVHKLLSWYLEPKMDNLADVLLALRPVVPSLLILGTLFFLATWFPSTFNNLPMLCSAMAIMFVATFLITAYIIIPRIKQMVFNKYPQCMSTYMEEGPANSLDPDQDPSESPTKSGIEATRIVEVLSISQAGFAFVTMPGYAAMAVSFLHHYCSCIQVETTWAVPFAMTTACAALALSAHRLYKMLNEKVIVDAVQGLSCQIATLLVCLCCSLAGMEFNFAAISLASVLSSDYFKRGQNADKLMVMIVHYLIPAVITTIYKMAINLIYLD